MYRGDLRRGATLDFKWSTYGVGGESITRATDGTVSVYKSNGTTQTTTGVTDTEDFDSLTGIHNCRIVTTDSFYEPGNDYAVVLSAATIDGEAVNAVIAEFSIENRFVGEAVQATAQGGAAQSITLASTESSSNDVYIGDFVLTVSGTGAQQMRQITSYTGSSRAAGVDRAWVTQPDSTTVYRRFPGSLGNTVAEVADAVLDEALSGHTTAGSLGKAVADIETDATAILEDTETTIPATLTTIDSEVGVIDGLVDAIKAKTDSLTFTTAGIVDANMQQINDVTITGDGSGTPFGV